MIVNVFTILHFVCKISREVLREVNLLVSQIRIYSRFFDTAVFRIYKYVFTSLFLSICQVLVSNRSLQRSHPELFKFTITVSATGCADALAYIICILLIKNSHYTVFYIVVYNFERLVLRKFRSSLCYVLRGKAFKHRKLNIFFHHTDARANLVAYLILFGRNAECLGALYSSVVQNRAISVLRRVCFVVSIVLGSKNLRCIRQCQQFN